MPCSSDGYPDDRDDKLNAATRAACELREALIRGWSLADLSIETRGWVAKHDMEDRIRERRDAVKNTEERIRKKALDKLTMDERRALGL